MTDETGAFIRMLVYQASSVNDLGDVVGVRLSGQRYRAFIARVPRR
jgi:hypothetical protein